MIHSSMARLSRGFLTAAILTVACQAAAQNVPPKATPDITLRSSPETVIWGYIAVDVPPGQTLNLIIPITAPVYPTNYTLVMDLYKENEFAFADKGVAPNDTPTGVAVFPWDFRSVRSFAERDPMVPLTDATMAIHHG